MVTIKDIARESKFSISVVSRALNPKPDQKVKASTEQTVKTVARQLGYRPNHNAAFMQKRRNPSIGVFLPRERNSLVADLVFGISDIAREYGLMLNFCFGLEEETFSKFLDLANKTRNAGVISYMPTSKLLQRIWHRKCNDFVKNGGKLLFINNPGFPNLDIPNVRIDNYGGGGQAAEYLINKNCEKLLCASFSDTSWQMSERTRGFSDFVSAASLEDRTTFCRVENINLPSLDKVKKNCHGPVGVFVCSDYIVLALIREFYHANRLHEIGKKFLILGYDNINESSLVAPAITTFCQDFQKVGRISMQKLANIIINGAKEQSETIQPELMVRESA